MNSSQQFNPILSQHAIERCAATVDFVPSLPAKAFLRLVEEAGERLSKQGFIPQPAVANIGIEFTPAGVRQVDAPVGLPRVFVSPHQSATIFISPEMLVWTSTSYVRWQPFIGSIERILLPLLNNFRDNVSINSAKLEYWDRFFWSGTWADFAVDCLLKKQSDFLAGAIRQAKREWHSHIGWFDAVGSLRRLTNVNIDIGQIVPGIQADDPNFVGRPSVGIYSCLLDQVNVPGYGSTSETELDERFVVARWEDQHLALKQILGHIITEEMANRIGLFSRTPPNARP